MYDFPFFLYIYCTTSPCYLSNTSNNFHQLSISLFFFFSSVLFILMVYKYVKVNLDPKINAYVSVLLLLLTHRLRLENALFYYNFQCHSYVYNRIMNELSKSTLKIGLFYADGISILVTEKSQACMYGYWEYVYF